MLAPEVKQLNTFSNWEDNWEDNGIRHKELDWGEIKGNEGKY